MKNLLLFIVLFSPISSYSQEHDILIDLDSIDKVIIIDHQNFNYEWYCGRKYDIVRINGQFAMRLVEQYSSAYSFGNLEQTIEKDSLDFSNMKTLEALGISVDNPDSLIEMVNKVVSKRYSHWSQKVNIENSTDTLNVDSFSPSKFIQLVSVVNDKRSQRTTSIPSSLGIDSSWSAVNASRLFELYKLKDKEPTEDQKNYCLSCFRDPNKVRIAAVTAVYGHHNTSDYPYVELQFIKKGDTLSLSTDIPQPFSLPWHLQDSTKYFNPILSQLTADLLPDLEYSNKHRLAGDFKYSSFYNSVEEAFSERMINRYCTDFNLKKKGKRRRFYIDEEKRVKIDN